MVMYGIDFVFLLIFQSNQTAWTPYVADDFWNRNKYVFGQKFLKPFKCTLKKIPLNCMSNKVLQFTFHLQGQSLTYQKQPMWIF